MARSNKRRKEYREELSRLGETIGWEDLTSLQKKSINAELGSEKVTPAMISYHTGIPESTIIKRMNSRHLGQGGVKPDSLRYRPSRGYYGKTAQGENVVLYAVIEPGYSGEKFYYWGTAADIDRAIRDKHGCPSPPCPDDADNEIIIPLKNSNERTNVRGL